MMSESINDVRASLYAMMVRYHSLGFNIKGLEDIDKALVTWKKETQKGLKPGFAFDKSDLREPSKEYDIKEWGFNADLRCFFRGDKKFPYGNNSIGKLLNKRGIFEGCTFDTESACLYVQFRTKKIGLAFLARLNDQPELKNFRHEL